MAQPVQATVVAVAAAPCNAEVVDATVVGASTPTQAEPIGVASGPSMVQIGRLPLPRWLALFLGLQLGLGVVLLVQGSMNVNQLEAEM